MDIAERIKLVRGKISQDDFAQRIGVHKSSLGRYERGESVPDSNFLSTICLEFGIYPQWILLGTGPMKEGSPAPNQAQTGGPEEQIQNLEIRVKELEREKEQLELHSKLLAEENKFVWEVRLSRDKDVEHYQKTIDGLMQQLQALTLKGEPTITDAPVSATSAPSTSLTSDE